MNNVYQFNKVIYKGNVNRDFYFYCLKKNKKLIKYLFLNIVNYIISILFISKREIYEKNKFKYLKEIKNIKEELKLFYKKNRYNDYMNIKDNSIIIDKVPKIFIINEKKYKKIIGYDLNDDFEVNVKNYEKELNMERKAYDLFVRNSYQLSNISCKKLFIVNNNKMKYLVNRKIISKKIKMTAIILLLAFILTCVSFCYTNYVLDMKMIISYFEPRLFLLNYIPILLLIILFYFVFKKLHISFLINSIIIMSLGIANQTKVLYRDDVVKFEDLTIFKEALTMSQRYSILIKWYTIVFAALLIIIFFLLRRFIKRNEISYKKNILYIFIVLLSIFGSYKFILNNEKIYENVSNQELINVWISTRQSQVRGLVYPFIYSIKDIVDEKPANYNKEEAEKTLKQYNYENIDKSKKVNIIAIMLEAYNDFSKYENIEIDPSVYEKFHSIEENSISGNLVTSIFGGGTIVTERNFLTGYYESPSYRKKTNSYVWYFKEQGYRTEAMHPIYGAFYNRASVNPNLGFDIYYNYENKFSNIQSEFLKDYDFFDYIIEGYEKSKSKKTPYFNFSVTYQNHGPYYSETYEGKEYYVKNNNYSDEIYNTFNEYISGIKSTNDALEKLINYFDDEDEPVIIVFFGDHNPYLGEGGYEKLNINLDLSDVDGFENYYETPYIIHANNSAKEMFNKNFKGSGNKISPIFLMNELFDYCDLKGNEYLQYMSDLKEKIDVINPYYYKENGKFIVKNESKNKDLIDEYTNVNYYYSRNYREANND